MFADDELEIEDFAWDDGKQVGIKCNLRVFSLADTLNENLGLSLPLPLRRSF